MGFIDEYVDVKVGYGTDKHYEELGYVIPRTKGADGRLTSKRGTTMRVKVFDLTRGSSIKFKYQCDNCGKEYLTTMANYTKCNHNGKLFCKDCTAPLFRMGSNNGHWNSNKTDEEREKGRNYAEYPIFVKKVLNRDKYTCQCCGYKGKNLIAHHLDGYDWCRERRFDETNGITLCKNCHLNFHSNYGSGGNTKEQFYEWFGKTVELAKNDIEIKPSRLIKNLTNGEVYTAKEIQHKFHTKNSPYQACEKKVKFCENVLIWNDIYENMTESEVQEYISQCQNQLFVKCMCVETKEVFECIADAEKKYGIYKGLLHKAVKGKRKTCGQLEDGTRLHWIKVS